MQNNQDDRALWEETSRALSTPISREGHEVKRLIDLSSEELVSQIVHNVKLVEEWATYISTRESPQLTMEDAKRFLSLATTGSLLRLKSEEMPESTVKEHLDYLQEHPEFFNTRSDWKEFVPELSPEEEPAAKELIATQAQESVSNPFPFTLQEVSEIGPEVASRAANAHGVSGASRGLQLSSETADALIEKLFESSPPPEEEAE